MSEIALSPEIEASAFICALVDCTPTQLVEQTYLAAAEALPDDDLDD